MDISLIVKVLILTLFALAMAMVFFAPTTKREDYLMTAFGLSGMGFAFWWDRENYWTLLLFFAGITALFFLVYWLWILKREIPSIGSLPQKKKEGFLQRAVWMICVVPFAIQSPVVVLVSVVVFVVLERILFFRKHRSLV